MRKLESTNQLFSIEERALPTEKHHFLTEQKNILTFIPIIHYGSLEKWKGAKTLTGN